MMQPGLYYVGDLCYVMHEEWDEFCSLTITKDRDCLEGQFQLADGREFAYMGTSYGDGAYLDGQLRTYSVDAGLIGCILVSDIKDEKFQNTIDGGYGHVVQFDQPFEVSKQDGVIMFGDVVAIDTEDDEGTEDYFQYDEEDEEE